MKKINHGIGHNHPKWILHIGNTPELAKFQNNGFHTLVNNEAAEIIRQTSNHWRKAFSIMAKISFALFETGCDSWQEYRDTKLLTNTGFEAISFEPYKAKRHCYTIICGFSYAETQVQLTEFVPHESQPKLLFHPSEKLAVTPYFDWRQLNNEKLAVLIRTLACQLSV